MAKRQRDWARRKRDWLFEQLGAKCCHCGATAELEFDVIQPSPEAKDHHGGMEWSHRISFYTRQFFAGNLQVLCSPCNSHKCNATAAPALTDTDNPF
jgi:hypothetical protein